VTIRGKNGHSAAFERLESHIHYAHSKESAVLDEATDYELEGYREDERQEVREERPIREGVRPIPVPEVPA
jgi:hypothetical protein